IVPFKRFRWLSGQERTASFVKPTGFRSDFCATCGSPVPNPLRQTAYYWVPAGLFEGAEKLEVAVHLYVGSKATWDDGPLCGAQYDAMPEMREFMRMLHAEVPR
ncbi:MAG: GFA family protein, partial [Burkholderiales bacterium]